MVERNVPPAWFEFVDTLERLRNTNTITLAAYREMHNAGRALAMDAWECGADDMEAAAAAGEAFMSPHLSDTARLDWLEQHAAEAVFDGPSAADPRFKVNTGHGSSFGATLREAIDNARGEAASHTDQRQVREDSQGLGEPGRLSPTDGVKTVDGGQQR